MNAAAFLAAIEQGDYETCLFLADWLEEQGRPCQARRLRTRYNRWRNRVDYLRLCARAVEDTARKALEDVAQAVQARGGTVSFVVACEPDTACEDALLAAYLRRLLEEPDHA